MSRWTSLKRVATPAKSSYLYFIRVTGTFWVKIGITSDPDRRLKALQTANPQDLALEYSIGPFNARRWESHLHKSLENRHIRGEWYYLSREEVDGILRGLEWLT